MLKKPVQQGRREFGDCSVILFHPPTPSCQDSSVTVRYVAGRRATENDAWEKARPGAPGRAGEKSGFFSILLGCLSEEERSVQPCDGDGHEFDRQQQSAHDGVRYRWAQDEMHPEKLRGH